MFQKGLAFLALLCLIFNTAEGQAWNEVKFTIPVKAELSDQNYRTLIIAEIVNERNRDDQHSRDIYDELANRISLMDDLLLLDRQKTESLLSEFEFQQSSGLVDKSQIIKLGEFYSSGVLAFIRIQRAIYNDEVKSISKWVEVNGCKTTKYREASYDLSINLKLIDIKTGGIVFSKNIDAKPKKKSKGYDCVTPPRFNEDELYKKSVEMIGSDFQNLFEDYEVVHTIEFQTNTKFNKELKEAITYLKINDFPSSYQLFNEMANKDLNDKAKSAALYNLAILQLYTGRESESLTNAKRAYLFNSDNSDCLKIIDIIE